MLSDRWNLVQLFPFEFLKTWNTNVKIKIIRSCIIWRHYRGYAGYRPSDSISSIVGPLKRESILSNNLLLKQDTFWSRYICYLYWIHRLSLTAQRQWLQMRLKSWEWSHLSFYQTCGGNGDHTAPNVTKKKRGILPKDLIKSNVLLWTFLF